MTDSENQKKEVLDWDDSQFDSAVMIGHKMEYIKRDKQYSKQNENKCIICKIVTKDPSVPRYEIYRNEFGIVFLNLYPYQTGHLMISPLRHVMGYEEYSSDEIREVNELIQKSLVMLRKFGNTESFNVGWNQGEWSGGSIRHHHVHIVPRYRTDQNFMETIARTKPFLYSLEEVLEKLQIYVPYLNGEKTIDQL